MIKKITLFTLSLVSVASLSARDILLEVKGSGFFPTSSLYKKIYHNAGMGGVEITAQMHGDLYAWASIDGFSKTGHSLIGMTKTKISYIPFGVGFKYLHPFMYGDLYVGFGGIASRVHIHDYSAFVMPTSTHWSVGGIAKVGCIIDLPRSFFVDLFFNYSFIKVGSHSTDGLTVTPHSARINAAIVGVGLGYRF